MKLMQFLEQLASNADHTLPLESIFKKQPKEIVEALLTNKAKLLSELFPKADELINLNHNCVAHA